MKTTASFVVFFLLGSTGIMAGGGPRAMPGVQINVSQTRTITGAISAVDLAYGASYPTVTVDQTVIKIAPLWFLLEQDFELKVGDPVSILVAPCNLSSDPYWYAISITNATGATIALRDAGGWPLWAGFRAGTRPSPAAGFLDPVSVRTISGIVERVRAGAGIQMPSLVMRTADGTLVAMKIGPERVLLAADFELNPGDTITAVVATCLRETMALQLTNSAGVTITLRNPDGTPSWN